MNFSSDFRKPKKIAYTMITVIIIFFACLTVVLTLTGKNNPSDSTEADGTAGTFAEITNGSEANPETPSIEPDTVAPAKSSAGTEPMSETTAESVPEVTENLIPADDGPISPFLQKMQEIETAYPSAVLALTEDMGNEYLNRIVFLGDSTTYGLIKYGMLTDGKQTKQVWTPVSGTLTLSYATISTILYPEDNTEILITEAVTRSKPDILVITLGINGVSFMDETYFKSEYTKLILLIREASPDTKIILQSIFPVARSYVNKKSINNEKIAEANGWIAYVANETGVKYANTASVLVGPDGYLPEEYQNGDGLHLNKISFSIELNYLRTHAYPEDGDS